MIPSEKPGSANSAVYQFCATARPSSVLHVVSFSGVEEISRPWRFTLCIASTDYELADAALLGSTADFRMCAGKAAAGSVTQDRLFHGVIRGITWLGTQTYNSDNDALALYEIEFAARLDCLRDFHFSEVYLDTTLNDVLRQVMRTCGLKEQPAQLAPRASNGAQDDEHWDYRLDVPAAEDAHTHANFVCQFEENCLDFVQRRLADAGAFYYFDTRASSSAIFCNDIAHLPQTSPAMRYVTSLNYRDMDASDCVDSFTYELKSRASQFVVRDFAGSKAALELVEKHALTPRLGGIWDTCVEHFDNDRHGQRLARLRAEAVQCASQRYRGTSRSMMLQAAHPITLQHYPHAALNGSYRIVRVRHYGRQLRWQRVLAAPAASNLWPAAHSPTVQNIDRQHASVGGHAFGAGGNADATDDDLASYCNEFEALPHDMAFRADPRTCARPRLPAQLSAVIEAEKGTQYAELNEHGCYKVRMPFARTRRDAAHGSAWIRFSSMNARAHFPLPAGTEVLLSFLNNDVDRPVIIGALANSEHPNVVTAHNAADNLIHTPGDNRLLMHDTHGAQKIEMSSPIAESKIEIGEGAQRGIGLTSSEAMHLQSSSYVHRVPGVYEQHILSSGSNPPFPMTAHSLLPSNTSLSAVGGLFVLKSALSVTLSAEIEVELKAALALSITCVGKFSISSGKTYYIDTVQKTEVNGNVTRASKTETIECDTRDAFIGADKLRVATSENWAEQYFQFQAGSKKTSEVELDPCGMLYIGDARGVDQYTINLAAGGDCSIGMRDVDGALCMEAKTQSLLAEEITVGEEDITAIKLTGKSLCSNATSIKTKASRYVVDSESFELKASKMLFDGEVIKLG